MRALWYPTLSPIASFLELYDTHPRSNMTLDSLTTLAWYVAGVLHRSFHFAAPCFSEQIGDDYQSGKLRCWRSQSSDYPRRYEGCEHRADRLCRSQCRSHRSATPGPDVPYCSDFWPAMLLKTWEPLGMLSTADHIIHHIVITLKPSSTLAYIENCWVNM